MCVLAAQNSRTGKSGVEILYFKSFHHETPMVEGELSLGRRGYSTIIYNKTFH